MIETMSAPIPTAKPFKITMQLNGGYVLAPYVDKRAIQLFNYLREIIGSSVVYYNSDPAAAQGPITVEFTNKNPYNAAQGGLFVGISCMDALLKEKVKSVINTLAARPNYSIIEDPQEMARSA